MTYIAADHRYETMTYRRARSSGVLLPAISLGLWHNFGDTTPLDTQRALLRRAFDRGVTHFDLANNYGPPYGSAETNFGAHFRADFHRYRDELFIASKAGFHMWPGPYGEWGSRKNMLGSLDRSLARLGLDYVDVFYSHRFDPQTPLVETMSALDTAVRQGKTLYVGISNYPADQYRLAVEILRELGTPLLLHQVQYSIMDRQVEFGALDVADDTGTSVIAYSPLAQGLLTDRYLSGVPEGSRMAVGHFLKREVLDKRRLNLIDGLRKIAERRGQTLAQLALSWVLRDARVVSVIIGASSVGQLEQNLGALEASSWDLGELQEVDRLAKDSGIVLPRR